MCHQQGEDLVDKRQSSHCQTPPVCFQGDIATTEQSAVERNCGVEVFGLVLALDGLVLAADLTDVSWNDSHALAKSFRVC